MYICTIYSVAASPPPQIEMIMVVHGSMLKVMYNRTWKVHTVVTDSLTPTIHLSFIPHVQVQISPSLSEREAFYRATAALDRVEWATSRSSIQL